VAIWRKWFFANIGFTTPASGFMITVTEAPDGISWLGTIVICPEAVVVVTDVGGAAKVPLSTRISFVAMAEGTTVFSGKSRKMWSVPPVSAPLEPNCALTVYSDTVFTVLGAIPTDAGVSDVPVKTVYELEVTGEVSALVATVKVYVAAVVGLTRPDEAAKVIITVSRFVRLTGVSTCIVRVAAVPMAAAGTPCTVVP